MSLQFGIQPFWFWNGDMNDDEICRQIREMHDKGVRGFFIHPRQGLSLPYLSKPFFDKAALAVEEAKKYGMEVWLYDEYPYPSGAAGGLVTLEHPEYAAYYLDKTCLTVKGGETVEKNLVWGRIVSAMAYPTVNGECQFGRGMDISEYIGVSRRDEIFQRTGLTGFNRKRYFTANSCRLLSWTAPAGRDYKVYIYLEAPVQNFKYFGNFVDPLNPDAIACYMKHTHEAYKKYLGHEFGKTIKGIFTDEVTAYPNHLPWSPLMPELVKRYGEFDILPYLPALTEDMGEVTAKVRYHYWNAATEGFIESYDKPMYAWCEANGLLYTGEKPILRSKQLAHVHIPGIDTGHQKAGDKPHLPEAIYRGNGKIASSAAHFYEKPGVLCEAFHSIGWGITMQDIKWTMDWLAASGVNWFVIHGYFYATDGLKKHDAPPSPFLPMPWWKHAGQISAYADYVGKLVSTIRPDVKLLLVDPVTTFWTKGEGRNSDSVRKAFARLQSKLFERGIDFYIADPALMAEGKTEFNGNTPIFALKNDRFTAVLLPFMTNIEPGAIEPLATFAKAGGNLLAVEDVPAEDIGFGKPEVFTSLFDGNLPNCRLLPAENAMNELEKLSPPAWSIRTDEGTSPEGLIRLSGVSDELGPCLFLINTTDKEKAFTLTYQGKTERIQMAPFASRLFTPEHMANEPAADYTLSIDGDFTITPKSPNALRLGDWEMTAFDQTAKVDSVPILDQLSEGGFSLPVTMSEAFGYSKKLEFPNVQAMYKTRFYKDSKLTSPVHLVIEPGALEGKWTLLVNGHRFAKDNFQTTHFYHNTNLAAEITHTLRDGENELILALETDKFYGGLRNPLYLMGDFAVFRRETGLWHLEPMVKTGPVKNLAACGLPFFAGTVEFTKTVTDLPVSAQTMAISDPDLESCVTVSVNGHAAGTQAWSPYRFHLSAPASPGENTVSLTLETTLLGLFEGQYYDKNSGTYRPV
ncbi:MAG TPA: hypothetical protein GX701_05360 [Clostridiales bacterium]|nr:hypothetical protein [Clostridiales bacterium]